MNYRVVANVNGNMLGHPRFAIAPEQKNVTFLNHVNLHWIGVLPNFQGE
jgi:hypothetical protein